MTLRDEAPTLILIVLTYTGFIGVTGFADMLGNPLAIMLLAIIIAMHSSLQHEILHGHPFRSAQLNDALVLPAIGLFIPYLRFKDTHLAHHYDPNLTDPYEDPETNFIDPVMWAKMPRLHRQLHLLNNSLLGRMIIGPAIGLARFYQSDAHAALQGNQRIWLSYALHVFGALLCLAWVTLATEMPIWAYLLAAYLGMSLLKIRTFLEHRAHDRAAARSVIIKDRGPLALLFLNNNYHAVHHAFPKVAWHRLPALFEQRKDTFLARNGGYAYRSYAQIFAQHLFRAKDPVAHPLWSSQPDHVPTQEGR